MTFFEKKELWSNLPSFISDEIEEMMNERVNSGIDTTPDETSNVIESFYKYICRIWILEALHVEREHPTLFDKLPGQNLLRFLYDILTTSKSETIGLWVFIARYVRNFFLEHNIKPFMEGLLSLDLGKTPSSPSPTAELLEFRNQFAHGAFHAAEDTVQKHYEILASCMENIAGLYTQKVVAYKNDSWYHCTQTVSVIDAPIQTNNEGVFLVGENGSFMSLAGLFSFVDSQLEMITTKILSSEDLFQSELIDAFIQRYIKEKNGNIFQENIFCDPENNPIPDDIKQKIYRELQQKHKSCLIEAYPGCGSKNILHHHKEFVSSFDAYFVWDIQKNDLTMSGYTFVHKILRTIESIIPEVSSKMNSKDILHSLQEYLSALEEHQKTICIFIHNIQIGLERYRTEDFLFIDVYNKLIEKNVSIIATIFPAQTRKGIFYDSIIRYPNQVVQIEELESYISELREDTVKKEILYTLKNATHPLHLFEICDDIDHRNNEQITFEPEIEYALWDMAAILATKREEKTIEEKIETVRVWSLFDSSITEYIQ